MRLTDVVIRNLDAPPSGQKIYRDDTLTGFCVRVSQGGTKTFVLVHGADRRFSTIGRYPIIGLAEARAEAKRLLAEQTLGKHRAVRLKGSEALTRFLGEQKEKNRPLTVRYTEAIIRNHFPKVLDKNLEDVRTDDVTIVTDRLLQKSHPGAASHAFTAIRTFLRWCVKRRYIPHSPIEGIDLPTKAVSRERVLNDDELRAVWKAAETIGGNFGKITQLLILIGARRTEVGSLRSEWLDLENKTCTFPSSITKNGREHCFPIGAFCADILTRATSTPHSANGYIFSGRTNGSFNSWSKGKVQLDDKVADQLRDATKEITPWTLHDLRRTYATNLQRLGIRLEVIEGLLNHVSGTRAGIVGIYQRHRYEAEMREAVNAFEGWFTKVILSA